MLIGDGRVRSGKGNLYLSGVVGVARSRSTRSSPSAIGGLVPLLLKRFKADPALASGTDPDDDHRHVRLLYRPDAGVDGPGTISPRWLARGSSGEHGGREWIVSRVDLFGEVFVVRASAARARAIRRGRTRDIQRPARFVVVRVARSGARGTRPRRILDRYAVIALSGSAEIQPDGEPVLRLGQSGRSSGQSIPR
jgi:hypothetical protein